MKKKNIFKKALLVITMVVMAMTMTTGLPALSFDGLAVTASAEDTTVAKVGDVEYTDFATALESWTDGTTLTLMADVTYETTIEIIEKTVTLDLNGHTLDMSALSSPIEVGSMYPGGMPGYLTIIDSGENGALKGELNSVTIWTGTLNLEGGDLTGRLYIRDTVNMIGGSVYLSDAASIQVDSKCIFNISGGTLSGTSGIWNNGTVNISGSPEITGTNYALANVGGAMTISGTPKLTGETATLFVVNPITLNIQPADETVWKVKIDGGANGVFAIPGDALEGELDPNKFESAVDGQEVKLLADGSLVLCNHAAAGGKYSVNEAGDVITDSCTVCGEPLGTATISAEEGTYNGSAYTAAEVTGTGTLENQTWTISYDCPDGCINAGDHTAGITLGDVTASKEFTIAPKPITVTADNASKTYGGTDPAFSYTVSDNGLVNSDTLTGTLSRETGENVGDYAITQGTLTNENNPNYDIAFVDGTFTINALSVPNATTAVQSNTLTYNGTAQKPEFTFISSGMSLTTFDCSKLTADDYDVEVAPQTNAGEYTATIKFKGNYTGTIENAAWSIGKAPLTVTANSYTVKLGNPLPAALEYTAAGLKGTDTIAAIGANVTAGYATAAAPSALGEYAIVVSGAAETDNYTITYVNGKLTIIEKDAQTITADDVALTYGDTGKKITTTTNGDGAFAYTVATGADVISVAADGTITALKAGTATVTITAAETADYAAAEKTISVTVNKKKIAVPAADNTEYTYNGKAQTYGVVSTAVYTVTGGVQTNAGEYPVTVTLADESYEWDGTLGTYTFVIKQAAVTVTAKSYTIKVDEELPTFDYTAAGLVNGEQLPIDVAIFCFAADSNTAGTFPITVSGVAESTNYTYSYVNGTLTISNKEEQTITASDVTLAYGDAGKKINATTNGDGAITYAIASDVIGVAADGTITAIRAGTATVTITAAETDDYAAATKTVAVTVNKAAVTIKANDYTVKTGDALPTFEYTVTGLVNGDALAVVPVITCTAADTKTVGTFDITITLDSTEDVCYTYTAQNGTLTVERKSSGGGGYSGGGGGYYQPTNPEINGKPASWSTIAADIAKLTYGSETTIELNGNSDVPVDVIKAIAEKDAKVTFIVDSTRSWCIDGKEIDTPAAADLSILAIASLNADALRGEVGAKLRIDGTNIPTELVVAFDKKHAGKFANLYMNKENELVFVDNIKVDENGEVMLSVSEKGDYVIMLCEYSDRKGDVSNDGVTNALDASAILRDIVELEAAPNPVMRDYNGDGRTNALDAAAILKDIVNDRI